MPVYIKSNANKILKQAIEKNTEGLVIEVEIGDLIEYKDKTPLEDNYRKIFKIK